MKSLEDIDRDRKWPKRKDNPFKIEARDPKSRDWVSLEWLSSMSSGDDVIYAEAYKRAGDILINHITHENNRMPSDIYFLPITYLYRHCLELNLKKIVNLGLDLQLIKYEDKIIKTLKSHKLCPIWDYARIVIERNWPNAKKDDLSSAAGIIQAFHSIDKSGQGLKYSSDLNGDYSLKNLPESTSLSHMQSVFEAIVNFLNGCIDGLIAESDNMGEYS